MKPQISFNPASPVHRELDQQIQAVRNLLNQLEPSERLRYTNEMIVKLLTGRAEKPVSTQEKISEKTNVKKGDLTPDQNALIDKITKQTEDLFRSRNKDHNY